MKIYFGTPGWGWTLWGIGYGSQWFLGFSMKRTPADDTDSVVLPDGKINAAWLKKITAQIPVGSRVAIVASGGMGRETLRNLLKEQGVQADSFGSYELANPADFDVLIFGRTSDSAMQALTSTNLQALDVGEFVVCSGN